jgi:hypothetical protein
MLPRFRVAAVWALPVLLAGCVPPTGYSYPMPGAVPSFTPPAAKLAMMAPTPQHAAPPASSFVLPPLNLPRREEWSSAQCPDRAVVFSGPAQPFQASASDTASFQEGRQFRESDYAEIAECFCAKNGDLSETTKPIADAVMAQTARLLADESRLRIRRISFVEDSPLGKYSELEAAGISPAPTAVLLRTYWRGQCSMRVATMSGLGAEVRAGQFLNSLHEVKAALAAKPEPAVAPGSAAKPDNAPPFASKAVEDFTSRDFGSQVKRRAT